MFSLVITVISIALVAALALATLYYGGKAFSAGAAGATAAKVITQGEQLLGASELYRVKTGQWPLSSQHLVDEGYLKSFPLAQGWVMPVPGQPTFVLAQVAEDVCRNVNKHTTNSNGILRQAYATHSAQCFGESLTTLKAVVTKGGKTLAAAAAVDSGGLPLAWLSADTVVPDASATSSWLVLPDRPAAEAPIAISTDFMRIQMASSSGEEYGFGSRYGAPIQRTSSTTTYTVRNTSPTFTVDLSALTVSSNFTIRNTGYLSTTCGRLGPNQQCSISLRGEAFVDESTLTATITLGMDMAIPGHALANPRLSTRFFAIND
jgi:hypothetical protein